MCKGRVCSSDKVTRVVIPLVTESVLKGNKGERVVKTNVWVKIKRNWKYLQEIEDNFKEGKRGNGFASNKD